MSKDEDYNQEDIERVLGGMEPVRRRPDREIGGEQPLAARLRRAKSALGSLKVALIQEAYMSQRAPATRDTITAADVAAALARDPEEEEAPLRYAFADAIRVERHYDDWLAMAEAWLRVRRERDIGPAPPVP